jgi:hypothetical protein
MLRPADRIKTSDVLRREYDHGIVAAQSRCFLSWRKQASRGIERWPGKLVAELALVQGIRRGDPRALHR